MKATYEMLDPEHHPLNHTQQANCNQIFSVIAEAMRQNTPVNFEPFMGPEGKHMERVTIGE